MPRIAKRLLKLLAAFALAAASPAWAADPACKGTVYLTLDTGSMSEAERIAEILNKHKVLATFFLANERTILDFSSLDKFWKKYWNARVAEGHAFGSHTFDHGYFRRDTQGRVVYELPDHSVRYLDADGVCHELNRVKDAFRALTGRALDPVWRAPGGRTTPNTLRYAKACGYTHIGWSDAGFLGDELPSDRYPNQALLDRALRNIRDGDVLMMHLGIWSRKDPFAPMLEPLIAGLKARGLCFARITDRKPSR